MKERKARGVWGGGQEVLCIVWMLDGHLLGLLFSPGPGSPGRWAPCPRHAPTPFASETAVFPQPRLDHPFLHKGGVKPSSSCSRGHLERKSFSLLGIQS